ncbi:MAG: tRNA uridine-5-carboxymethylaminomethyl(34) synthesis GTPase MnmE [Mycoplasmataceae bacterium]|jgi:tRNA modification GTPase|nr:tRNA uridine-5-carboxymethylaminomethyl(34) synthesis GTPase MnmE [Mycoplasmataceae bacterium]
MKTIVALSTPPINGAIHIIRVSGSNAFSIVNKVCFPKLIKKGYIVQKTKILNKGKKIDDVLVSTFVAPKTFTGEDVIEINCHGGIHLANMIINLLIANGCVLAKPGEFSERAFLNHKLTIHQAEAINNLIKATSDKAVDFANNGLTKEVIEALNNIKDQIFTLLGQVEVNIDYPEFDDVPQISHQKFLSILNKLIVNISSTVDRSKKLIPIKDGINVAIIGKPNVGKSSLLNALLNQSRVIVSNVPGTTRDIVNDRININGVTINFLDTPGLHHTKDKIESMGIIKVNRVIQDANLILWVIDGSKPLDIKDKSIRHLLINKEYLVVINKCDLKKTVIINGIQVSAKNKQVNKLINAISSKLKFINFNNRKQIILQSTRAIGLMEQALNNLNIVKNMLTKIEPIDLTSEYLLAAHHNVLSILGKEDDFNFINEIFRKFCVGK